MLCAGNLVREILCAGCGKVLRDTGAPGIRDAGDAGIRDAGRWDAGTPER